MVRVIAWNAKIDSEKFVKWVYNHCLDFEVMLNSTVKNAIEEATIDMKFRKDTIDQLLQKSMREQREVELTYVDKVKIEAQDDVLIIPQRTKL